MNIPQLFDMIDVGILTLDSKYVITGWNRWMENNGKIAKEKIVGKLLFQEYPNLDNPWFKRNCSSVFRFGSFAFLSQKIHGNCFPFEPISSFHSDFEVMQQDCTIGPVRNGKGMIDQIFIVVKDVTQIAVYEKKIISMAEKDGLTGINNRKYLDSKLPEEFERHRRYNHNFCLIMIDIDFFKKVNDTWGHLCGDKVLKKVTSLIQERIRNQDIFARYGGEEFVLLLPETGLEDGIKLAESLRKLVELEVMNSNGKTFSVTISMGISALHDGIVDSKDLLTYADKALYEAKSSGRNKVVSIN